MPSLAGASLAGGSGDLRGSGVRASIIPTKAPAIAITTVIASVIAMTVIVSDAVLLSVSLMRL
ncbi:hypothetical protein SS37A_05480 [Methylocystis iwaonis]|uniref:Uncharacterized protein n=1 Tax=Methylocystis iwaonis TaxID=2885079 RepID=A0ABN6VCQ0_9HYPH|nr:hypothetical protein SS37A_05480 [Methylocystis iwaonis]